MSQWLFGFQISQAIYVATKLSIADLLKEGPLNFEEIARIIKCDSDAVYRLLRTLASINIFEELSDKYFANTDLSSLLMETHESSIKSKVLLYGEEPYQVWGKLIDSVKSGEESFTSLYKNSFYSHLYQNPERFEVLSHYLKQTAAPRVQAILQNYDFSSTKTLVDVGGGSGCMLAEIIQKYTHIKGVLLDCDPVIADAKQEAITKGTVTNIEWVSGNYLESVPPNADTYLLSHIIHSLNDEQALIVLNNCHRAMSKDGKLILIEALVNDKNKFDIAKWMDLNMLVTTNGRERTEKETLELLGKANFRFLSCVLIQSGVYLIEAQPLF